MNKILLLALVFPLLLLTQPATSYSVDTYGSFADDGSQPSYEKNEKELLSLEVSKSNLHLILLGTITNGKTTRVLIKNPVTGELGKYIPH